MYSKKKSRINTITTLKDIGVHESTISNWESGLREPNLNTVIMISKYFDVSIDYLLGNKVTIPEHYIIVNEAFPGCIDYLYSVAMNLNIQQREKLIKLIKRFVILQRKGEQL